MHPLSRSFGVFATALVVASACSGGLVGDADAGLPLPDVGEPDAFVVPADAGAAVDGGPADGATADANRLDAIARDVHDAATPADAHDAALVRDVVAVRDGAIVVRPPLPVPAALLRALSATPYVEQSCRPTTWRTWPYPALRCTYNAGIVVTVADPTPARVGAWIVDAAEQIAAVSSLRTRDPAGYVGILVRIAQHTMSQSSRIFPLEGNIEESVVQPFLEGVTYGVNTSDARHCATCYCRINSTTRDQWCAYVAGTTSTTNAACLASYGGSSGWNDAWAAHCLANHQASWTAASNPHYRAQAWLVNRTVRSHHPDPTTVTAAQVHADLDAAYPIY